MATSYVSILGACSSFETASTPPSEGGALEGAVESGADAPRGFCEERVEGNVTSADVRYFADASSLPSGAYRISYAGGCMKYGSTGSYTVHRQPPKLPINEGWGLVGESPGDIKSVVLPGIVEFDASYYTDIEACVRANPPNPTEFDHKGGKLGIGLFDNNYIDNYAPPGRSPAWLLHALDAGCGP
jgi:hypothetical protein